MLRGIICAVLLTSALGKYKSVVQVTCPKSCTSCQCKGCKNITLPLGKCVGAGQGAGVIGSCSGNGAKFTEDIYFNAKCQGQAATKSVINTDACIEGSETHEEVAFFCSNDMPTEERDKSFVRVASATSPAKDALVLASSPLTNKYNYGDPATGCKSDEVGGSLTGMDTYEACYPKCLQYNACPTDLPDGTTAKPGTAYGLCMLNGPKPEYDKHCMLMCKGVMGEGSCPAPTECVVIPGYEFSLCQYPTKFGHVATVGGNITLGVIV